MTADVPATATGEAAAIPEVISIDAGGVMPAAWTTVEYYVQRAIERRFRLAPLSAPSLMLNAIERADRVALATERRDLLVPTSERWPILDGVEPAPEVIVPWSPAAAAAAFTNCLEHFLRAMVVNRG